MYKNLSEIFQVDDIRFKQQSSLYFFAPLVPLSSIGVCSIFLGSWSQISLVYYEPDKDVSCSFPWGQFYSWLESLPVMETEALKWKVEEIFSTEKSPQCPLISF